jgi:hypothetical protein
VFYREGVGIAPENPWSVRFLPAIWYKKGQVKTLQKHQWMHLSTHSHPVKSRGWKKSIAELNQNKILQIVERADFLAAYAEQKSGPFGLMAPACSGGRGQGWVGGSSVFHFAHLLL